VGALSMEVGVESEDVVEDVEGSLAVSVAAGAGMLLASTRGCIAGSGTGRPSKMRSLRPKRPGISCVRNGRAPASAACTKPHRGYSTRRNRASVWTKLKRIL